MGLLNNDILQSGGWTHYAGASPAALGVSSFANNFLQAYMGMQEQARKKQELESINKLREAQAFALLQKENKIERGMEEQYDPKTKMTFGRDFVWDGENKKYIGGWRPLKGKDSETINFRRAMYEAKEEDKYNADSASLDHTISELRRLGNEAKELRDHPGLWRTTGILGKVPNVPGTPAADAAARLETLRSQTAFSVLQTMRQNSKTGGALGQVSDKEGELLQNNLGALSQAQSTEAFKASLNKIIKYTEDAEKRVRGAYSRKWGGETKQEKREEKPAPKTGKRLTYNPKTGMFE